MHGVTISADDMVDSAKYEVDEGGLYIVLTGDFTKTFNRYLRNVAATGIRLLVDPQLIADLERTDPGEGP